ncbi:hypothetical protein BU200_08925 [Streptococcus acidominimus]|uniref:Uncharacterized protein n=1 Tax=Streptococcus acidominimus TaxID=1326 RepID=A0A1Q8EBJ2_STRAI|nr:hypothetical protein BU200_08925 [Streptococcus acidominimus]
MELVSDSLGIACLRLEITKRKFSSKVIGNIGVQQGCLARFNSMDMEIERVKRVLNTNIFLLVFD